MSEQTIRVENRANSNGTVSIQAYLGESNEDVLGRFFRVEPSASTDRTTYKIGIDPQSCVDITCKSPHCRLWRYMSNVS